GAGGRVATPEGGVAPRQAGADQVEVAESGAVVGEGKESGADVVPVAGQGVFLGPDGAAGAVLRFEDENLPAVPGQGGAGDEAIRGGPDDNGVHHAGHFLGVCRLGLFIAGVCQAPSGNASGNRSSASPRP